MLAHQLMQAVAGQREVVLDQDRERGVVGQFRRARRQATHAGDLRQAPPVVGVDLATLRQRTIDVLQLQQAEGRVHLAHLAVDAGGHHRGLVDEAEVLQPADALVGLGVRADDGAALEGVEHLGGMEAEHAEVAVAQDRAAVVLDPEGVRGVVDDLEVVGVGDALDRGGVARRAVAVYRHDRGGMRGDRGLDLLRVQVQRDRVDVHEHRLDPFPQQRVRGGHERVGRGNHFAGDAQRLQRGEQGQGAVCQQGQVSNPKVLRQRLFQRLVHAATVGQDAATPDLLQVRYELVQGRQQRAGDGNGHGGLHGCVWKIRGATRCDVVPVLQASHMPTDVSTASARAAMTRGALRSPSLATRTHPSHARTYVRPAMRCGG